MELVNKVLQGYVDGELKDIAPSTRQDNVFLSTNQEKTIEDGLISVYTHTRSGTVNEFTGTGPNGKALMTADIEAGDTFTVNGQPVTAYMGTDQADSIMAGSPWNGKWISFAFDGTQINFNGGGSAYTPPAYSAEETPTGETWTDGKPIYRKVLTSVMSTANFVPVGASVDNYVRVEGFVLYDTGFRCPLYSRPSVASGAQAAAVWAYNSSYAVNGNTVQVEPGYNQAGRTFNLIVEYTKVES